MMVFRSTWIQHMVRSSNLIWNYFSMSISFDPFSGKQQESWRCLKCTYISIDHQAISLCWRRLIFKFKLINDWIMYFLSFETGAYYWTFVVREMHKLIPLAALLVKQIWLFSAPFCYYDVLLWAQLLCIMIVLSLIYFYKFLFIVYNLTLNQDTFIIEGVIQIMKSQNVRLYIF